jgi:hypothetical protein
MLTVNLVPILATPFAVVAVPEAAELNPALAPFLQERAAAERADPTLRPDPLCFRSREDLFDWPDAPVIALQQALLAGVCAAVMDANSFPPGEFAQLGVQARARFAIVRPNGAIPAATAPLASWYGLYCVAAPPASPVRTDSATVRLYAVRGGMTFIDAANWRMRPPFGANHHIWRPVPGQMAVFPASMLHEVALNRGSSDLILVMLRTRFAGPEQAALPPW